MGKSLIYLFLSIYEGIVGQTEILSVGKVTGLAEGSTVLKLDLLRLKINLVLYPASAVTVIIAGHWFGEQLLDNGICFSLGVNVLREGMKPFSSSCPRIYGSKSRLDWLFTVWTDIGLGKGLIWFRLF